MRRQNDGYFPLGIAVILLIIIGLWLAVPHGPAPVKGKTVIRYWTGWTGHELIALREVVDEFNKEHPDIYVRVVSIPSTGSGVYQKTRIAMAGHDVPDVCSTIWASELSEYAARGYLEPLDDNMKASHRSLSEYLTAVGKMLRYNDKTYALAITCNTQYIVYNRAILREVGWNPDKFPQTIPEMDKLADKCVIRDKSGNFVRYGYRPGGLVLWARVFGGKWYDPATGKITADDPGNIAALEWMASRSTPNDLRKMTVLESSYGSVFSGNSPYYCGKVGFRISGEWEKSFVNRYKPGFDWGYAPLPHPVGGKIPAAAVDGSVFVIPVASKHKREAWIFLNWITQPEHVRKYCTKIENLAPLRVVALAKDADPVLKFSARLADSKESFALAPPIPIWQLYRSELERAEEKVLMGGADPKKTLEGVTQRVQKELDRFERYAK